MSSPGRFDEERSALMARRELGPATLAVVQAVERVASGPLLVACSGGADSLALALASGIVARRRDLAVRAVVVDHGLQAGSGEVAGRVVRQLALLDAAVVGVQVDVAGDGLEAAARTARYRALEAAAAPDELILLGHTLDDQAETVLLGLARGSGVRSLAGMPARRGRFVRPLLGLRRETTWAACTELGVEPWDDPHNASPGFARARVRHRVLPVLEDELGPGIAEALARTAALARADADLLDDLAARLLNGRDDPVSATVVPGQAPTTVVLGPTTVVLGTPTVIPGLTRDLVPTTATREIPDDDRHAASSGAKGGVLTSGASAARGTGQARDDVVGGDDPVGQLDVLWLTALPEALRSRVVRRWLVEAGGRDLSAAHIQSVLALITDWHGQGALDLPGVTVSRGQGVLQAASVRSSPGEAAGPDR